MRKIGFGFVMLWRGRGAMGKGDISAFNALMTALSATVGIGNIAGVATAIHLSGRQALFLDVVYRIGRHGNQIR
ncbi:MAG: alanine:cation symporter family protein [Thiotrichaceae bacterium]